MLYIVHNYSLNVSYEMSEEELETHAPELASGEMEIFQTIDTEA